MITQADLIEKLNALPRTRVRCEHLGIDEERVLVEGDRGLRPDELGAYALERIEIATELAVDPTVDKQGLLGKQRDGKLVRWARGKELTYAVLKRSFESEERYDAVVEAMTVAAADWMNICGVRFTHDVDRDDEDTPAGDDVVFTVAGGTTDGGLAALAFFPDDLEHGDDERRIVFVFDTWFAVGDLFDPIGIIRHELGHVLGFRHEHIRPETPEFFKPESLDDAQAITDYDPKSVMHYLGKEVGDKHLRFTDLDKIGARRVYGGPNREFFFID